MTFEPADRDRWLDTARSCDYATFFHTPHWHRLGLAALPGSREASVAGMLGDGRHFVLPLVRLGGRWGGLCQSLVSGAAGCYGGPILDGAVDPAEPMCLVSGLSRRLRAAPLQLTGNPFAPFDQAAGSPAADFTQLLAIDGSFDDLFTRFSSNHRNSVRKGRKRGVTTRRADSDQDFHTYYDIYEKTIERWGDRASSRYTADFFHEVRTLAMELPENVQLWLAEYEGRVVAGALVFFWNRHAVYWHGAALAEFFSSRATLVLQAAIIEYCIDAGYAWYDFNPSGGHEGVMKFKEGFGAERRDVARARYYLGFRR